MGKILSTLNQVCLHSAKLNLELHHDTDGIKIKQETMQTQVDQNSQALSKLVKENNVLKGIVQRQFHQINKLNDRVAMLTARSMEINVMISVVLGDKPKEDCKDTVITFLRTMVEIDTNKEEILVAHRAGKPRKKNKANKNPRIMIVRCVHALKECIMTNVKNLKDKENAEGKAFYINKQLPEKIVEQNRETRQIVRNIKEKEDELPMCDKSKIEIKNKTVYVNGSPVKKALHPPEPVHLYQDNLDIEKLDKIKLATSDIETEGGSNFQAFAFKTGQLIEVQRAYRKVRTLHPAVAHIMCGYVFKSSDGYQDDGEYGASH